MHAPSRPFIGNDFDVNTSIHVTVHKTTLDQSTPSTTQSLHIVYNMGEARTMARCIPTIILRMLPRTPSHSKAAIREAVVPNRKVRFTNTASNLSHYKYLCEVA